MLKHFGGFLVGIIVGVLVIAVALVGGGFRHREVVEYGEERHEGVGDGVGAGIGDVVIAMQEGGSAREVVQCPKKLAPIDVAICGIVDTVDTIQGSFNQFARK